MSMWKRIRRRFNRNIDRDIERELRAHLDLETDEQTQRGLTTHDAHDAARRAFGNLTSTKEQIRQVWIWSSLEQLTQDLRYTSRLLRRNSGFTAVTVACLALGIGSKHLDLQRYERGDVEVAPGRASRTACHAAL